MAILNPRVDFAFKKLFGTEENKEILISFINAVVSKKDRVADVALLNPYNHKEHQLDKLSILDIKATDEHGRQYNIEMQISDQTTYNQRALYYWAKLYTSQLQKGDEFGDLRKTVSINLLNFNYLDDEPNYHNIFKILNVQSHKSYFEDLEIHFIELQKFDANILHIKTALDRWIQFLKKAHHYEKENFPKELRQEPAIEKAFLSLNTLSLNKDEREVYEARLKWLRDESAALKKSHQDGRLEGKEETALNLLKMGFSLEDIAKATQFPLEKIKKLKKQLHLSLELSDY